MKGFIENRAHVLRKKLSVTKRPIRTDECCFQNLKLGPDKEEDDRSDVEDVVKKSHAYQ
jgi:hypothetical protein